MTQETKKRGRKPKAQQVKVESKPKLNTVDHKFFFDKSVEIGHTTKDYEALVKLHSNGAKDLKERGINKVLEFGSGLGFFLQGAKSVGIDYLGYDINPYERDFAISKGIPESKYVLGDGLDLNPIDKYDACYCVEVFEHIADDALKFIIKSIHDSCEWLFMTSTPHRNPSFDEQWGHINIKDKKGWIDFLSENGYEFIEDWKVVTEWGLIFKRKK